MIATLKEVAGLEELQVASDRASRIRGCVQQLQSLAIEGEGKAQLHQLYSILEKKVCMHLVTHRAPCASYYPCPVQVYEVVSSVGRYKYITTTNERCKSKMLGFRIDTLPQL